MKRAALAAIDLRAAMDEAIEKGAISPAERAAYARDLFLWSFYESAWYADPRCPVGTSECNDNGAACGVMQLHVESVPASWLPLPLLRSCAALRADRRLGYLAAIYTLAALERACGGSRLLALAAYSTNGACGTLMTLPKIVKARCAEIPEGC